MIKEEGFRAFYQGLTASYLGVIESSLQWVIYEHFKKSLSQYKKEKYGADYAANSARGKSVYVCSCLMYDYFVDWLDYFLIAAASKWIACVSTYPHEVLRTRLRQGRMPDGTNKYSGLKSAVQTIYREEGMAAFYGGMTAHLMRVVPNSAIMFFCYEVFVHVFTKYQKQLHLE